MAVQDTVNTVNNISQVLQSLATLFNHPKYTGDIRATQQIVTAVINHPDPVTAFAGFAALLQAFGVKF